MNARSLVLASLCLLAAGAAVAATDVPVSYTVDETALKTAVSGTSLTFELHRDSLCSAPVHSQVFTIDNVLVSKLKRFKPMGGARVPKTDELHTTLTGVTASGHLYLKVTGTGITPIGGACQIQASTGDIPPTCNDGVKNQDESDVDCGGALCARCALGLVCSSPSDCSSQNCSGGLCAVSCMDGIQNQDETGVDCGGTTCPLCGAGYGCASNADCETTPMLLTCAGGACVSHCNDGVLNGDETDIDCGGGDCHNACAPGQICYHDGDCASNVCLPGGTCQ